MGKLDYRTLRENVADEIRMKILNGDMKPGDKIIEQELASEFGISRGPVREALRQLEQEGMVEYSDASSCSMILSPGFISPFKIFILISSATFSLKVR